MSADKRSSGLQDSGKEERDQGARPAAGAGKCATMQFAHDEQTLVISQADAEALLASRFGWSGRGIQTFVEGDTGDTPPDDDDASSS